MKEHEVKLHLVSGAIVIAEYEPDEYDYIYDAWAERQDKVLGFVNCCVHARDILLIEYS